MIDYSILLKTYNDNNDLIGVDYHTECHNDDFMWSKKQAVDLFLKITPRGYKSYSNGKLSKNCITNGPMYSDGDYKLYIVGPTVELIKEYHHLKNKIKKSKNKY